MKSRFYTREQLLNAAQLNPEDTEQIMRRRRRHNRLGFGYQLCFVRLTNRFPAQQPFEIFDDILSFASAQLDIPFGVIDTYASRQATISEHQEQIRKYLEFRRFDERVIPEISEFVFHEACRLEQTTALLAGIGRYLREHAILKPSDDTLRRLIARQKQRARRYIFDRICTSLSESMIQSLDELVVTKNRQPSALHRLKLPPGRPSPKAIINMTSKLEKISATGVLELDLAWLNNNFQRSLARHAKRSDANRLRKLEPNHRRVVLVCFLCQLYRDTMDHLVDMYDKLINKIYNHARRDVDDYHKSQRKQIRASLRTFDILTDLILDASIDDDTLRQAMFDEIGKDLLLVQKEAVDAWLNGKHSHTFHRVKDRFSYIRQFSPHLLKHIRLLFDGQNSDSLEEAVTILRKMNIANKRKLPDNVPVDFIPKTLRPLVESDGKIEKSAWECALLTAICDEIRSGNISIDMSKRFARLDNFFMPVNDWRAIRETFFGRAGLPADPSKARGYLTKRLNRAYENFLEQLDVNTYAGITGDGWQLSVDPADQMSSGDKRRLESLRDWLADHMRIVKLPELLIDVDNELKFSRHFMSANQKTNPGPDEVCAILTTVMAHGCNIGLHTMAQLVRGASYSRIKNITDWMLNDETQRAALALVVNAISELDITQYWGEGRASSSDGQRWGMNRKVLQQTWSPKFNDFALEFYSFVADNFAPFFSLPIECTDRDAPYVLDGLLYNESDLPLDGEHYTDTHGYTENNFAAFAMLGRRFAPRIRGLHKQRIYRIDRDMDYGAITPIVCRNDRTIHLDWIEDQWDRMGHFYASLEYGHATASTAMKRLNGFSGKNHFYRANRELGRIFKTEYVLRYMSDKTLRQNVRKGLLKGEQIHSLARDLKYGKRGRISIADIREQKNSCSCMTLILASIIYWQAKEINRVVAECDPKGAGVDLSFVQHISPITWDNVILYGEYNLDRNLIKI